jgi:hypothetical protein
MNNTVLYWDHLQPQHGQALACAPIGGDPDYVFVCAYVTRFLGVVGVLSGIAFLYAMHENIISAINTDQTKRQTTTSAPKRNARTRNPRRIWQRIPNDAYIALVLSVAALSGGLSFLLSGAGTSHPIDEFRGQLGDGFCKYPVPVVNRSYNSLLLHVQDTGCS